ncbi:MAG: GNAT family N-acetyltransferase [Roseiflexaceae bacterium]
MIDTLQIRQLHEADSEPIDPVLKAAYRVTISRAHEVRRNLAAQPDGWLIAESGNQPVGMVGVVAYDTFAYVGLMAVDPSAQRLGIGNRLMVELLDRCDQRGYPPQRLDATAAGAPLYQKHGFVTIASSVVYEHEQPFQSWPQPVTRIRPIEPGDLPALIAFDTPRFGADRGRVLSHLLAEYPERAWLSTASTGQITGYLFAQAFTIGPWVASTPTAAADLLDTALAATAIERPRVLADQNQAELAAILTERGFRLQRELAHMCRGSARIWGQPTNLYGKASFALG